MSSDVFALPTLWVLHREFACARTVSPCTRGFFILGGHCCDELSVSSLQMQSTCCATVWSCCPSTSPARMWKTKCQRGSSSGTLGELLIISPRTLLAICTITYTWLATWLRSFTALSNGDWGSGFVTIMEHWGNLFEQIPNPGRNITLYCY